MKELHKTEGNSDSTLGGCTQGYICTGTKSEAEIPQEPGPNLPAGPRESAGDTGVAEAHTGNIDTGGRYVSEHSVP